MKQIYRIIFNITLLVTLAGCNDVVFLEPLEAPATEYALPHYGGEIEIDLSHGDYVLEKVTLDDKVARGMMSMDDGREFYGLMRLDGSGTAAYESPYFHFNIKRNGNGDLQIETGGSQFVTERVIELHLSDGFQSLVMTVTVDRSFGYNFDRIEYGEVLKTDTKYEQGWSVRIPVSAEDKIYHFDIFNEELNRIVHFPAENIRSADFREDGKVILCEELMQYVNKPFHVPVPEPYFSRETLVFDGLTAPFGTDEILFPLDMPSESVNVRHSQGNSSTITAYWKSHEYQVRYKIWFRHELTSRQISLTGIMRSKVYTGNYYIESKE